MLPTFYAVVIYVKRLIRTNRTNRKLGFQSENYFIIGKLIFEGPLKDATVRDRYCLLAVDNLQSLHLSRDVGTDFFNSWAVIKILEEQICQLHGNLKRILRDGHLKFESVPVRDFTPCISIG